MEGVDALHVAIEIPDSRFDDFAVAGAPQLVADTACADFFVLGPAAPDGWRTIDLASHPVVLDASTGAGANVLGDPRIALALDRQRSGEARGAAPRGGGRDHGNVRHPGDSPAGRRAAGRFRPPRHGRSAAGPPERAASWRVRAGRGGREKE